MRGCASAPSGVIVGTSAGRLIHDVNAVNITDEEPAVSSPTGARILAVSTGRTTTLGTNAFPEQIDYALTLVAGHGVFLFSLPRLEKILWPELVQMSRAARLLAVDQLSESNPSESFRIALVSDDPDDMRSDQLTAQQSASNLPKRSPQSVPQTVMHQGNSVVALYQLKPGSERHIKQLGVVELPSAIISISFGGMTIVATTSESHCMIRIARDGGLAIAAHVRRFRLVKRRKARGRSIARDNQSSALASIISGIGGLFGRRQNTSEILSPVFATPMPEDRWLLVVDMELEAYSSFGAKIEDMEHVFKSKAGLARLEGANHKDMDCDSPPTSALGSTSVLRDDSQVGRHSIARSASNSSLGSTGTMVSSKYSGETNVTRSEKLPLDAVFVSPFVLSMTSTSSLMVFAANGSVSGGLQSLTVANCELENGDAVVSDVSKHLQTTGTRESDVWTDVRLLPCPGTLPLLAYVIWANGELSTVELRDSLSTLIDQYEADGDFAYALALVSAADVERTLYLRRMLATEARSREHHVDAIRHMECIVNIAMKNDMFGQSQQDLLIEATELRGASDTTWRDDPVNAALWADFLYQLRCRVMRPSPADVSVLETLCAVDISASRVKALLFVPHSIEMLDGERLIISSQCSLSEKDRMSALVALYQSVKAHDKALSLLEDFGESVNDVSEYLSSHIDPDIDPEIYFRHMDWVASDRERHEVLLRLLLSLLSRAEISSTVLEESFKCLVRGAPYLIPTYMEHVLTSLDEERGGATDEQRLDSMASGQSRFSSNILATSLLAAMTTARELDRMDVVEEIRPMFRTHVLQRAKSEYDVKSMLTFLRNCEGLQLHEELAFLLGQRGEHSLAAAELAAEDSMTAAEALKRLKGHFPPAMHHVVASSLASAYLSLAAKGKRERAASAAEIVALEPGHLDPGKVLRDAVESGNIVSVGDAREFAIASIEASTERLRLAQILRAARKSDSRILKEQLLLHRRKHITISRDRCCAKCGRAIGEAVFAACPDGSVVHLVCHLSSNNTGV